VCTGSAEQVDKLDTVLWTYDKESFLPHGTDRNDAQDLQPVLLTANIALASAAPNNATVLLLLDNMLPEIHAGYQRCLYMFDGGLDGQVQAARRHWKEIKDKGLPLTYWQQTDTGGWTKTTQA
jgi:DNA polymerase-3 subunit chi